MDMNPGTVIALIGVTLGLLTAFAGVVGGFIRIEVKTNTNTQTIDELWQKVDQHSQDRSIHPPVDELDRRFDEVKDGMQKIDKGIEKLTERFDKFLTK